MPAIAYSPPHSSESHHSSAPTFGVMKNGSNCKRAVICGALTFLCCFVLLMITDSVDQIESVVHNVQAISYRPGVEVERRTSAVMDPTAVTEPAVEPTTAAVKEPTEVIESTAVTVYLTQIGGPNPAWSIFNTDTLLRYGSGTARYIIEKDADCECSADNPPVQTKAPCLAVSRGTRCSDKELKCKYPQCKTVGTNDEVCKIYQYDAREYYTSNMPNKAYVPLGPRLESWKSFQKIQRNKKEEIKILPASKRRYAFNAIFSQETSLGREELAHVIKSHGLDNSNMSIFMSIAEKQARIINSPRSGMLNTDDYMKVLLRSTFTLTPAGHNPECFRLHEAVEAGSIPVFALDDHYHKHPCKDSLRFWVENAPIVIIESWEHLYPTLVRLLEDPARLDERQASLRIWYEGYMRDTVGKFESFIMDKAISEM